MKEKPLQNSAIAYLRQLCCSGLSKEIVLPEFLRAVQAVIPSGNNGFNGIDEQFNPTYTLLERGFAIADIEPLIVTNYYTPEHSGHLIEWLSKYPVLVDATVFDKSFYLSDMYNLVYRQYDQHHLFWALVRQYGKPAGLLLLNRPSQQKPFTQREQVLCSQLLPYLSHALQAPESNDIQYAENGSSGMIIMNTLGSIIYLSQEAKVLLALASYQVFTRDIYSKEAVLLTKLARLCQNLETIFRGKGASPPSWYFDNPNGRFKFCAFWLNKQNNESGGLVGMTLEHQEPKALKILRGLQNLPLSPTQKKVSELLAQGFSNEKIGECLHIKLTTVKDHISKIFIKLDIHRREELLPMLLASAGGKSH